jgi:chromosome condensin MukBEF ATPase and DNA-binding subunit MukB
LLSLQLYAQSQAATQSQYDRAGNLIAAADAEIARMQQIMDQIDELQNEWNKIQRIGDIVKAMRDRVMEIDRRL